MINQLKQLKATTSKRNNAKTIVPTVYFRGINRIHVNRFKAYTQILSNRLTSQWHITQDIKAANVVVEQVANNPTKQKQMRLSVLTDQANLKPPTLFAFNLTFEENKLVKQLNQASKRLSKGFQGDLPEDNLRNKIKVCGLLNESLSVLCDLLNKKSSHKEFSPCMGLFSSINDLYRDELLLIVDPQLPDSMHAYQVLVNKKSQGNIIIDQLTIAIIQGDDENHNEDIFDLIYGNADASTQVTLLNPADERDIDSFVEFF